MWVGAQDEESMRALHLAADLGLNFIDTALAYGDGYSERLIGRFLKERRETIYVATKAPPKNRRWPASGQLHEAFPGDYVKACAETSLRNLGVDRLDLLQLHVWDPAWLPQDDWRAALESLKQQGKVAYVGVSVNDHDPGSALSVAASGVIDVIQVIYNIFDQSAEGALFPLCMEKQVGVIARVPFDEGALTGHITPETRFAKKDWRNFYFRGDRKQQVFERAERLRSLLGTEASSLPALALRFCLRHPAVSTVIAGMRTAEHVSANLALSDEPPLSEDLVTRLREHRWRKNFYR
jgi:aryl-alcohol dehydrogenase-like predicted oxidoreductase